MGTSEEQINVENQSATTDPELLDQTSGPIEPGFPEKVWWGLHSNTTLLAIVLIVVVCIAGALLLRPLFNPSDLPADNQLVPTISHTGPFRSSQDEITYYIAWGESEELTDIYRLVVDISNSTAENLTNTSHVAEYWPVPSPIDERLAFFSVSVSGDANLMVMDGNGEVANVTYNVQDQQLNTDYKIDLSVPPQWSQNGQHIAFVGCRVDTENGLSEIFIAEVATSQVWRLTRSGNAIYAFSWLDSNTLLYAEQRQDDTLAWYQIGVLAPQATPVPLITMDTQ